MPTFAERYSAIAAKLGGNLAKLALGDAAPSGLAGGASTAAASLAASPFAGLEDATTYSIIGDKIVIDAASLDGDIQSLLAELQALGLESGSVWGNTVSGLLPISALETVSQLSNLNFARGAQASSNVGSVDNEADVAMTSDDIRASDGLDGTGITIGIMSDSYDNLGGEAADIASGDLPNNVAVLLDLGSGGIDEGRAMAQLVHDIVPAADLIFRTAFLGQADFANGITALVNAGADVITDDIFYFAEPFFQDGIIAQSADQAVASGVAYYTSAGNSSDNSYEATFSNSGQTITYVNGNNVTVTSQFHDFDPGVGIDTTQSLTFQAGGSFTLGLQWDNPFSSVSAGSGGAIEDYDILLTDNAGAIIANLSASSSVIGGDPLEIFQISNNGSTAVQANLSIVRTNQGAQATDNFIKYVLFRSGGVTVNEFDTQSSTVIGHSNADLAVSVGAAFWAQTPEFGVSPPVLEGFSSVGRTDIIFDTNGDRLATPEARVRPNFVAPDGSNNTFFGSDTGADADANPNFFGTSAAAPNAAAVAAQLLQSNPNLTPAEINAALAATAIDMDDPRTAGFDAGVDDATGAGLIQAAAALAFLEQTAGPIIGTNAADTLTGTSSDDVIQGLDGDDIISGLGGNDDLQGGAGADRLDGGTGADQLTGGAGNDTYLVDNVGDVVTELVGEGDDAIEASISFTIAQNVETLTLAAPGVTATGNASANTLIGNTGAETLDGLDGDDILQGLAGDDALNGGAGADSLDGGAGADAMAGGADNDAYIVDNADDTVTEAANEGTDSVTAFVSHTLSANTENLTLAAPDLTGTGNAEANVIIGNTGAETLNGLDGDDQLQGLAGDDALNGGAGVDVLNGSDGADILDGGTGADAMTGGAGDDTYAVDDVGDVVAELANEGVDTVQSAITHILAANVENLTLTVAALTGTGNTEANVITGNTGAETLNGLDGDDQLQGLAGDDVLNGGLGGDVLDGGAGADAMAGGAGDDTYTIDDAGDVVTELANEGVDTAQSAINFTLGDNIENLTLLNDGLTGNGNGLANILIGAAGAETLNGLGGDDTLQGLAGDDVLDGGAGADAMTGGQGNDAYIVDDAGDTTVELAGEGEDTVTSSISYTLVDNVERLILTVAGLTGTGNTGANTLTGSTGDDILNGKNGDDVLLDGGGSGIDRLIGGVGDDRIEGGDGTDRLFGQSGVDLLIGGNGADRLFGQFGVDTLEGGAGADLLDGGFGVDTMSGGLGDDIYTVDESAEQVIEALGEGTDTVNASADFTLSDNIENLTLTAPGLLGTGNGLANILTGNTGAETLNGAAGDDILQGLGGDDRLDGGLGADAMTGGLGNDAYVVDDVGDVVSEANGEGVDTVEASVSFTLSANLENLALQAPGLTGTGNAGANTITGSTGAETLNGDAGDDTLQGLDGDDVLNGGLGADAMTGGLGNDRFNVDDAGDTATEGLGEGVDTVVAAIDFTLGVNIENLELVGASLTGTGNGENNVLSGGIGAQTLNGLDGDDRLDGGAGVDTMTGGLGDDTYVVDNAGDIVIENANEGTDTVEAAFDFTLSGNIENLTLTSPGRTGVGNNDANRIEGFTGAETLQGLDGDDELLGQAGDDQLDGGAGADRLDGGSGADIMTGGLGDDLYVVDDAGDVIVEGVGEGLDTVEAATDFTLSDNIENLTMTAAGLVGQGNAGANTLNGSSGADALGGGAGADVINGNDGDDLLEGGPGADADKLVGGNGDDHLEGGDGDDHLYGNLGRDVLSGGNGDDILAGQSSDDSLFGNAGADMIDGGSGNDIMVGGAGDDTYVVDSVGDIVIEFGGEGLDTVLASVDYTLAIGAENLTLTTGGLTGIGHIGTNTLIGSSGADTLDGAFGSDILNGGDGDDILRGGFGIRRDTLIGGAGNDQLDGGSGDDRLFGNSGADTILGGAGADMIVGQSSNDTLTGGAGADTFSFKAEDGDDQITDFTPDEDIFLATGFGFANGADVLALAIQVNGDVIIDLPGSGSVILTGVSLATLDAADFAVA